MIKKKTNFKIDSIATAFSIRFSQSIHNASRNRKRIMPMQDTHVSSSVVEYI
jgi:hypothetical protein